MGPNSGLTCSFGSEVVHFVHCGKGEIRTLDTVSGMPLFESGAFNHSATFPCSPAVTDSKNRCPRASGVSIETRSMLVFLASRPLGHLSIFYSIFNHSPLKLARLGQRPPCQRENGGILADFRRKENPRSGSKGSLHRTK